MKPTIESPKVFISYAWGSQEYQNKVVSLAKNLISDGIDVLLDKWSLKEGHDKYAYMEQCVTAEDVTNVLILLDPVYAQKADVRLGGVGTETQIISSEIYNKVKQEKFIPIIMEREEDFSVPKPQYLKSILHFDLSNEDSFDEEYKRLVKRLYGIEIINKPELGNTPKWVTEEGTISSENKLKINSLKKMGNTKLVNIKLNEILNDLRARIVEFNSGYDNCLDFYNKILVLRDEYLEIFQTAIATGSKASIIGDFFKTCIMIWKTQMFHYTILKKHSYRSYIFIR